MSEAKHTPGPWEIVRGPKGQVAVVAGHGSLGSIAVAKPVITNIEANARLIAAAPLLLAYAECDDAYCRDDTVDWTRDAFAAHGYQGAANWDELHQWLTGLRRRALAAAKGGAS